MKYLIKRGEKQSTPPPSKEIEHWNPRQLRCCIRGYNHTTKRGTCHK